VPWQLTDVLKQQHFDAFSMLPRWYEAEGDDFWVCMVTVDEAWVSHF
jgi:hypothetical protein